MQDLVGCERAKWSTVRGKPRSARACAAAVRAVLHLQDHRSDDSARAVAQDVRGRTTPMFARAELLIAGVARRVGRDRPRHRACVVMRCATARHDQVRSGHAQEALRIAAGLAVRRALPLPGRWIGLAAGRGRLGGEIVRVFAAATAATPGLRSRRGDARLGPALPRQERANAEGSTARQRGAQHLRQQAQGQQRDVHRALRHNTSLHDCGGNAARYRDVPAGWGFDSAGRPVGAGRVGRPKRARGKAAARCPAHGRSAAAAKVTPMGFEPMFSP